MENKELKELYKKFTNNGFALEFVKEQTSEICLAAVKQNGFALEFVKKQTPEICLAAVNQNLEAFKYVYQKYFK